MFLLYSEAFHESVKGFCNFLRFSHTPKMKSYKEKINHPEKWKVDPFLLSLNHPGNKNFSNQFDVESSNFLRSFFSKVPHLNVALQLQSSVYSSCFNNPKILSSKPILYSTSSSFKSRLQPSNRGYSLQIEAAAYNINILLLQGFI